MAVGDPIKLGSAQALPTLIPQPGGQVTTNVFGTDTIPLVHLFADHATAMSARPARGAAYSGPLPLTDFKCHDSHVEFIEGKSAKLTVIYKRHNPNLNPFIELSSDLHMIPGTFFPFIDATAAQFAAQGYPEPIVTKRYSTNTQPDVSSTVSSFKAFPDAVIEGFPNISQTTESFATWRVYFSDNTFTLGVLYPTNYWRDYRITFFPLPFGWRCMKLGFTKWCDGAFYEVTEVWKTVFLPANTLYDQHP